MTRYFRIQDSGEVAERAFLAPPDAPDGGYVDVWQFTAGNYIDDLPPLTMRKRVGGPVLPFSMAAYEIPVVNAAVGDVFKQEAGRDVQLIPVQIDEPGSFFILNAVRAVNCFDEQHSVYTKYPVDDESIEPELRGKYEIVTRLRIDASKASGCSTLRIAGWLSPLIVSDPIRARLEQMALPGVEFTAVS